MKLTDPARDAILDIMRRQELDPQQWYLEFRELENGAIGLGFTQQALQQVLTFGELRLTIDEVIDSGGVLVDYGEFEGKNGIFFSAEPQGCNGEQCEDCDGNCQCDGNCGENCKCKTH